VAQNVGQSEFLTAEAWDQENPFAVAARMSAASIPIYIAVGDRDQFGFQEGSAAFAELMKSKVASVDFYLIKDGGHCSYKVQELADYLEPSLK
jgi:pimeloyl-ACP methyl ester carboxylesterase